MNKFIIAIPTTFGDELMFYKPNYCCNCGDKIERIEWYAWTNRRFCQVCETEHQLDDWLKRIFPTLFLLFGIFGFGVYLSSAEEPLNTIQIEKNEPVPSKKNIKPATVRALKQSQLESVSPAVMESDTLNKQKGTKPPFAPLEKDVAPKEETQQVLKSKTRQNKSAKPVYFCGAATKKGTPCSRHVKGGGRCWQHTGREAMLAEKDLKIDNN